MTFFWLKSLFDWKINMFRSQAKRRCSGRYIYGRWKQCTRTVHITHRCHICQERRRNWNHRYFFCSYKLRFFLFPVHSFIFCLVGSAVFNLLCIIGICAFAARSVMISQLLLFFHIKILRIIFFIDAQR